jgi:hypothetical protein
MGHASIDSDADEGADMDLQQPVEIFAGGSSFWGALGPRLEILQDVGVVCPSCN